MITRSKLTVTPGPLCYAHVIARQGIDKEPNHSRHGRSKIMM